MIPREGFGDGQSGMLNPNLFAVLDDVAGDVSFADNRATLETASQPDQARSGHSVAKRILPWPENFAVDRYFWCIDFVAAEDADGVKGFEDNWVFSAQHV